MDKYVFREHRIGSDYPPALHVSQTYSNGQLSTNRINDVPETMYVAGYRSEFQQHMTPGGNMASGIDPGYLARYTGMTNPNLIGMPVAMSTVSNVMPTCYGPVSFESDYQNRPLLGPELNRAAFLPLHNRNDLLQRPESQASESITELKNTPQQVFHQNTIKPNAAATQMVLAEAGLVKTQSQVQIEPLSRADKLKELYKTGVRVFSGPVEKVLKWHKLLQDIGIPVLYEIVGKCVNVSSGKKSAKNLVVRDDGGPAMQVVYYEIDLMLPELKPSCTVRVVGRMLAGSCRLQAFSVRPASGDDVATLSRRAAVAAHHVAKLCADYAHPTHKP